MSYMVSVTPTTEFCIMTNLVLLIVEGGSRQTEKRNEERKESHWQHVKAKFVENLSIGLKVISMNRHTDMMTPHIHFSVWTKDSRLKTEVFQATRHMIQLTEHTVCKQRISLMSLTAHSKILFCQSSEFWRKLEMVVLRTRENTSICWAAVEMLVISPWNPASDISCEK